MKLIAAYNRFSAWLQAIMPLISGLLIALAAFLMVAEVISRYIFHASHGFMEEIPRYLAVYATFFIAPVLLKRGEHVNVDLLPAILKGRKRQLVMLIIYLLTFVTCVYLLIASLSGIVYHYQAGTASFTEIEIPMWVVFLSFVIGAVLLLMYSVELSIRSLLSLLRAKTDAGEGEKC